jgi:hypothetical protein
VAWGEAPEWQMWCQTNRGYGGPRPRPRLMLMLMLRLGLMPWKSRGDPPTMDQSLAACGLRHAPDGNIRSEVKQAEASAHAIAPM